MAGSDCLFHRFHRLLSLAKGLALQSIQTQGVAWWLSSLGGLLQAQVDSPRNFLPPARGAQPTRILLLIGLLHLRGDLRDPPRTATAHALCQSTNPHAGRHPNYSTVLIALAALTLDRGFRLVAERIGWIGEALWPNGEYWRAFGLILAWPLFVYNWFTAEPLWGWLILGFLQTFVLIPFLVWKWGKGAYCGWICSCGALAETLGDTHRHKMPHGPGWNRLNLLGQGILALAFIMMLLRILGWVLPDGNLCERGFAACLADCRY